MPLLYISLWKVLCKENWDIIYILSEMGCQPELSERLVAEGWNHFLGFVIQKLRLQENRKTI